MLAGQMVRTRIDEIGTNLQKLLEETLPLCYSPSLYTQCFLHLKHNLAITVELQRFAEIISNLAV